MSENQASSAPALPRPVFDEDHCKGCGRCVAACPKKVLRMKDTLNKRGVNAAEYIGSGCIGCAICFYNCPEPYAIEVHTPDKNPTGQSGTIFINNRIEELKAELNREFGGQADSDTK